MKVRDVLARKDELKREVVTVSGRIVGWYDDVFIVSEDALSDDRRNGIRIGHDDDFGPKFGTAVPGFVGGPFYEKEVEAVGILGAATVAPFPLEFVELQEMVVHFDGQDFHLDI